MPITKVNYQRTFVVGPYANERIGAEIELGQNQDPMEALAEIAKMCLEFHTINNPHLAEPQPIQYSPPIGAVDKAEKPSVQEVINDYNQHIKDIEQCTDLKILETYWLLSKKWPEIGEAYEAKKKELVAIEVKDIIDRTEALTKK